MHAVMIELRREGLWVWGLVVTAGWAALLVATSGRWLGSWPETAVWTAIPMAYLASFVAAGSAMTHRARMGSQMGRFVDASARRPWQPRLLDLVVSVLVLGLLPVFSAALGAAAATAVAGGQGRYLVEYPFGAALLACASVALGRTVAGLVRSRAAGPPTAFAVGLFVGIYANPTPPSSRPWLTANPVVLAWLVALVAVLLVASELLTGGVGIRPRRPGALAARRTAGVCALIAAMVGAFFFSTAPRQVERQAGPSPECRTTDAGSSLCVWPDDTRFLDVLLDQAGRLDGLSAALSLGPWSIEEPGLHGHGPQGSDRVVVEPVSLGDGMWLTASSMSYALVNSLSAGCDVPDQSDEEWRESWIRVSATLEVLTTYLRGAPHPEAVWSPPSAEDDAVQSITTDVLGLTDEEQHAWLIDALRAHARCPAF